MQNSTLIHPIPYLVDTSGYFLAVAMLGKPVWLDSGKPYSSHGRFDILTADPVEVLLNPTMREIESAVDSLGRPIPVSQNKEHYIPFWGGAIGYFNYEFNAAEFAIPPAKAPTRPSAFGIFSWAIIQDHLKQTAHLICLPAVNPVYRHRLLELIAEAQAKADLAFSVSNFKGDLSEADYLAKLQEIRQYIVAGDAYQVNFAQRFSGDFSGSTLAAYLHLRKVMPSPHSAFLQLDEDAILSFSPERFIQINQGQAITQPIKGTIARGKTLAEDQALAETLKNSAKNLAENVMIVDLLRNDFSKHCRPFSVKVPTLFSLESFANVHHLVSTVTGELETGVSALAFFMACFPGGSITGAPKKRAMEIIHELEDQPRNIYCGSVCYLSSDGNFDSSIAIRTLLISENKIVCWGGGGIVIDSDPQEEYRESLQKIGVLIAALHNT